MTDPYSQKLILHDLDPDILQALAGAAEYVHRYFLHPWNPVDDGAVAATGVRLVESRIAQSIPISMDLVVVQNTAGSCSYSKSPRDVTYAAPAPKHIVCRDIVVVGLVDAAAAELVAVAAAAAAAVAHAHDEDDAQLPQPCRNHH